MFATKTQETAITCDEATIMKAYTKILTKLKWIHTEIKQNEKNFSNYPIANHPVKKAIIFAVLESNKLLHEKLGECFIPRQHAEELKLRLNEYQTLLGTPMCRTAKQAYDLLATHVVKVLLERLMKDLPTMPALIAKYSEFYASILSDYSRLEKATRV